MPLSDPPGARFGGGRAAFHILKSLLVRRNQAGTRAAFDRQRSKASRSALPASAGFTMTPNLLPGHREAANPEHRAEVARYWGVDSLPANTGLSAIELFARLYDDEATRDQIQSTLLDLLDGFPMTIRIEVVVGLAEVAHLNQDTARALELSVLAEEFLKKGAGAPAETRLPIMGDVARIRHYGGDDASARDMLENASKLFTSKQAMARSSRAVSLRSP